MSESPNSVAELLQKCASGDPIAWEEFIARFHPLIARTVVRTARKWGVNDPAVFDDLIQEVYLKLCSDQCRILTRFTAHDENAIYGFLKVVTINSVHDIRKADQASKRGSGKARDPLPEDLPSTAGSFGGPKQMERQVLLREVEACLESTSGTVSARDRAIFWMYYRDGLTASAIAALPTIGLTTKGVESLLLRLTRLVRLCMDAGTGPDEGKGFQAGVSF